MTLAVVDSQLEHWEILQVDLNPPPELPSKAAPPASP